MDYEISEVKKGLYKISSPLGPRFVHQYLLTENESAILIDSGMKDTPNNVISPALKEIGVTFDQLKTVIISHADVDHFSGLENLKKLAKHSTVIAHKLDAPWIESTEKILEERYFAYEILGVSHDEETKQWFIDSTQGSLIDIHINGDEVLHLGSDRYIDIIHTPGHSPGHLSIYDRNNRAAIVIDAILWKGLYDTNGKIISPPPYYSVSSYLESIEKILSLDVDVLLTGHFNVITGEEVKQFLQESINFVHFVGKTVEELINASSQPLSLREILDQTNAKVGNFTAMMVELVGPVYAHLVELEKEQKIIRKSEESIPYWIVKK